VQADNRALQQKVVRAAENEPLRAHDNGPPSSSVGAAVDPLGAPFPVADDRDVAEHGRRLTSSPTYVAVDAQQIHELPSGHTCSNTGFSESNPYLVRLDSSGPSLSAAPTVASSDVSFASVDAKDYTVSEIQRMAAPFKVIHASDCATAPTLEIPLNTNFAGTLSVGGKEVQAGPKVTVGYVASADQPNNDWAWTAPTPRAWVTFTELTKTVNLAAESSLLIWYSLSWLATGGHDWKMMESQLLIDGVVQPSASTVNGVTHNREVAGNNQGLWMGTLAAGSHTFTVQISAEAGGTYISRYATAGEERILSVLVL